jgi:hypothetical protein
VWKILKRLNMNCLPHNQRYKRHETRWRRYEKPRPEHRIQVDVTFLERIANNSEYQKKIPPV